MAPRVPSSRGKIGPAYRSDRRVDFCVKHVLKHARTSRRIARANRASRERRKSFRNPGWKIGGRSERLRASNAFWSVRVTAALITCFYRENLAKQLLAERFEFRY